MTFMTLTEKCIGLAEIAANAERISHDYALHDMRWRVLALLADIDRELEFGPPTPAVDCLAPPSPDKPVNEGDAHVR